MGIEACDVEFLLEAKRLGVDFAHTLTVGRQELKVDDRQLAKLFGAPAMTGAGGPPSRFAEPVFSLLGAETVEALDASPYEGANVIHDLNEPVDPSWHGQYSCIYDGGSLEHVFNFPVAIKSCMEMVREGGHLLLQSPANNQCGHGFYQFSPELFYRILCRQNGFVIERMVARELFSERRFLVADPAAIGSRVELTNSRPLLLLVQARRTTIQPVLRTHPQQSDYAAAWTTGSVGGMNAPAGRRRLSTVAGRMSRSHPAWTRRARRLYVTLGGRTTTAPDLRNRRFFEPLEKDR